MKRVNSIKEYIKKLKTFFINTINNYLDYSKKYKFKSLVFLIIWLIIVFLIVYISLNNLNNIWQKKEIFNKKNNNYISENIGSENFYLEELKKSLQSTSSVFDNFIAFTPDPSGRSTCVKSNNGLNCQIYNSSNNFLTFPATNVIMPSTKKITESLLSIVIPVSFILISMQGFNFIFNDNKYEFKTYLFKILSSIILIYLTPYILSISIIGFNQLSSSLLQGSTLTEFITKFVNSLEVEEPSNIFLSLIKNFLELGNNGGINPLSYLYALPIIIPLGLVLLLLLYISFQFILRFLNLYFLSAIYPLAIVFSFHSKTSSINTNFWKQWTTFLIQQPTFIIGFIIIKEVLAHLFTNGISLEVLIVFLGLLLFLSTIHVFASKIWGDVYTAIANNITAGIAAGFVKSSLIDKPLEYASRIANIRSEKSLDSINKRYLSSDTEDKKDNENKNITSNNYKSPLSKELSGLGYSIKEEEKGKLQLSGNFYKDSNDDSDITKLYISKNDAIKDGINTNNIEKINLSNISIQDGSNKKMLSKYNNNVKDYAAENNGHAKNIGISYKSSDKKVINNMEIAKSNNLTNGIQGIGIKNDSIIGDKTILGDNLIKIHVYKDVINNKNESN